MNEDELLKKLANTGSLQGKGTTVSTKGPRRAKRNYRSKKKGGIKRFMGFLPLMLAVAVILFALKANNFWSDAQEMDVFAAAHAEEQVAEEAGDPAADPAADNVVEPEPLPEGQAPPLPTDGSGADSIVAQEAPGADEDDPDVAPDTGVQQDASLFTQAEVQLLESLSQRREELEKWARELEFRENVLEATEKRIDDKIAQLKQHEETIRTLMADYDEDKKAKILRLVRTYEKMKPKKAAAIFEELEMDVLLDVAERMGESKLAKVLASMDPSKAKAVTVELAKRRELPDFGGSL